MVVVSIALFKTGINYGVYLMLTESLLKTICLTIIIGVSQIVLHLLIIRVEEAELET